MEQDTIAHLFDSLNICPIGHRYDHPAVFTCDEADSIASDIPGGRSKNLFLRNKDKSRYYLVSVLAEKRVDIATFSRMIGETKLSFASPEDLLEQLGLTPGSVSPIGLMNDTDRQVRFYLDSDLSRAGLMGFHPNTNTATWLLDESELRKFLAHTSHAMIVAKIPEKTE
ncbi:MAG TPA: prolyl-tRNA synthetase associated domain-containing protein [bacterium]|nr:prolyl-tRNA synthetase associated domain-containing protein [bacterium]